MRSVNSATCLGHVDWSFACKRCFFFFCFFYARSHLHLKNTENKEARGEWFVEPCPASTPLPRERQHVKKPPPYVGLSDFLRSRFVSRHFSPFKQRVFSLFKQRVFSPFKQRVFSLFRQRVFSPSNKECFPSSNKECFPSSNKVFSPFKQRVFSPSNKECFPLQTKSVFPLQTKSDVWRDNAELVSYLCLETFWWLTYSVTSIICAFTDLFVCLFVFCFFPVCNCGKLTYLLPTYPPPYLSTTSPSVRDFPRIPTSVSTTFKRRKRRIQ